MNLLIPLNPPHYLCRLLISGPGQLTQQFLHRPDPPAFVNEGYYCDSFDQTVRSALNSKGKFGYHWERSVVETQLDDPLLQL
jgi:hypothetical protein